MPRLAVRVALGSFALALAASAAARAQPAAPPPDVEPLERFTPGIRLGVGQSFLAGLEDRDDVEATHATIALAVGGVVVVWAGWVALQAEAMLARRGAQVDLVSDDALTTLGGRVDLTYLDLAVLARFQGERAAPARVFAVLGPALAIALDDDAPFAVAPWDVALTAGAGLGFGPVRRGFTAELRGSVGLRDVSDEPGAGVRNLSLLVLAGFEL